VATGLYTPLQLIALTGLLANTGVAVAPALSNAVTSYNSVPAIDSLLDTLALASSYGLAAGTITQLKTLGAGNCPALAASVPTAYANTITPVQTVATIPTTTTGGFAQFVLNTGNKYLGNGDISKFTSVWSASTSYQSQTAQLIYSTVNANKLVTTFTNMNNLITGDITKVTLAVPAFAEDLRALGNSISLSRLNEIGTPAGVLQQISVQGNIVRGTVPSIAFALIAQGLSENEIVALCTPNQSSLTLSRTQFNSLQRKAYDAMVTVTGTDLQEILDILNVTTPGIQTLADLLNPVKLFGNSWRSLMVTTDDGSQLIYNDDGTPSYSVQRFINQVDFGPNSNVTGCDELSKIIPQEQAIASVALAVSMSQIPNIIGTDVSTLARVLS
jgi:hypothetical protein